MLAAGGAIDPYWNLYKQHNEDIEKYILEPMKIGYIKESVNKSDNESSINESSINEPSINDPYINDPIRSKELKYFNKQPCNAATPIYSIMDNWITPNDLWYIRNHHPVPKITGTVDDYKISIRDYNNKLYEIRYGDIINLCNLYDDNNEHDVDDINGSTFKKNITTTIQCGGNRRAGLNTLSKTSGTPWNIGAISTAKWEGILLKKLLEHLKVNITNDVKHVHFESIDGVKVSIPIEKVLNNYGDVIIAYKMNSDYLPEDHGFPLRLIVPGFVGIRNIKWLKSISLSDKEIDGPWQSGISYKGIPHYIKDLNKLDEVKNIKNVENISSIYEMPVQSCIVDIVKRDSKYILRGFAWSGEAEI